MTRRRIRRAARGMTLIEIMVVLVILGMIAGAVAYNVLGKLKEAEIRTARIDIGMLRHAVETWRFTHPTLPDSLEQLVPSEIRQVRPDPWGTAFVYIHEGDKFEILSYGPDRVASDDDIHEEPARR